MKKFFAILKEKDKYKRMKDNLRSESGKYVSNDTSCKATYKTMRLSSIKSNT